jgi:hypothetical protein
MERKCEQCQRTNVSASDHHCDECARAWKVYGWLRFAKLIMGGLEPEEDRKSIH